MLITGLAMQIWAFWVASGWRARGARCGQLGDIDRVGGVDLDNKAEPEGAARPIHPCPASR